MHYKFKPFACSTNIFPVSQSNTISTSRSSWLLFESISNYLLPCAHSWSCFSLSLPYTQERDACPVLHSQRFLSLHLDLWYSWDIFIHHVMDQDPFSFSCRLVLLIKRLFSIALLTIFVRIKWLYVAGPLSWVSYSICWPVSVSLGQYHTVTITTIL